MTYVFILKSPFYYLLFLGSPWIFKRHVWKLNFSSMVNINDVSTILLPTSRKKFVSEVTLELMKAICSLFSAVQWTLRKVHHWHKGKKLPGFCFCFFCLKILMSLMTKLVTVAVNPVCMYSKALQRGRYLSKCTSFLA